MTIQRIRSLLNNPHQRPEVNLFIHKRRLPRILLTGLELENMISMKKTPDTPTPYKLFRGVLLIECQQMLSMWVERENGTRTVGVNFVPERSTLILSPASMSIPLARGLTGVIDIMPGPLDHIGQASRSKNCPSSVGDQCLGRVETYLRRCEHVMERHQSLSEKSRSWCLLSFPPS